MTIFLAKVKDLEICILSNLALSAYNKSTCAKIAYSAKSIYIKDADTKAANAESISIESICIKSACTQVLASVYYENN